ncbi:CstA-like transporter-associated (seleno)protein [Streptomyces paludis]|uniref:DUF466 domain-containing protein n=1 Tax=Streptomyces paludis TaxID=2282738 RepID=A0A345HU08_9ACTN|nr:YbdD/YjiX family protein [Streptomyces paludis]AXG80182.1 DUF466 domain-containing protein [Streptomyces paludis]
MTVTTLRLRHLASRIRWYVRELTGESAYDHYVTHTRTHTPEAPLMDRRAFERHRTATREADPREGFRCC